MNSIIKALQYFIYGPTAQGESRDDTTTNLKQGTDTLVISSQAVGKAAKPKVNLDSLPYDIIVQIFDNLNDSSIVCMSLSCTQLWRFCQAYRPRDKYPDTYDLKNLQFKNGRKPDCQDWRRGWCAIGSCNNICTLGRLLRNWMGPYYHFHDGFRTIFLPTEIYGGESIDQPRLHMEYEYRWRDYSNSRAGNERFWLQRTPLLPCPYGMGETWYEASILIIVADRSRHEQLSDWRQFWDCISLFTKPKWQKAISDTIEESNWGLSEADIAWLGL